MIYCKCGEKFDGKALGSARRELHMHIELAKPLVPRRSPLIRIPEHKIVEAEKRYEEWKVKHGEVSRTGRYK